jgi:hypothetical protein
MSSPIGTTLIDPDRAAESNATGFLVVICVFWSLAFVTACVRVYTRAILVRSFGKDDAFMVLAVVSQRHFSTGSSLVASKRRGNTRSNPISYAEWQDWPRGSSSARTDMVAT